MNLALLLVTAAPALASTTCIAAAQQGADDPAGVPAIGPRAPVGPDVPLTEVEKAKFAQRVTVGGRTAEAVRAACERAVKEGVSVLFLPAGEYVFDAEVKVPGGLTLLGEGSRTVVRTKDRNTHLFSAGGDRVRFTRLKLQGATLYVDDVYLGTEEPPAALARTGQATVQVPKPPAKAGVKGEGYSPLKPGTVRLWDANKRYTMKHYDLRAWQNRANWSQVPYGATDYRFRGEPVLEGENFWVSLHASSHDAVFLYAKTDAEATPGRHNELYRVFDTPNGLRNYGGGSQACHILKNTPEELLVESDSITYERGGHRTTVTTRYRLLGGKRWVEIQPVSQADEQGMHGESRFVLAPEANEDGSDFVDDSLRRPGEYVCRVPNKAKMLLDLIMDDDTIWVLTTADVRDGTKLNWPGTRFYAGNAPAGWHAGWSLLGEGECDRVWTAPFALFAGQPVYVGVLRIGYWHYQHTGQNVTQGEPVTLNWHTAYKRQIVSSPFRPGGAWCAMYPGRWRPVTSIDGRYYTVPLTVTAAQTVSTSLTFDSPATGKVEYVLFYLYDRTEETPKSLSTPMDIYREVVEQ